MVEVRVREDVTGDLLDATAYAALTST